MKIDLNLDFKLQNTADSCKIILHIDVPQKTSIKVKNCICLLAEMHLFMGTRNAYANKLAAKLSKTMLLCKIAAKLSKTAILLQPLC